MKFDLNKLFDVNTKASGLWRLYFSSQLLNEKKNVSTYQQLMHLFLQKPGHRLGPILLKTKEKNQKVEQMLA